MTQYGTIRPEDYLEPACPLCEDPFGAPPSVKSVPQRRIREKLDAYMARRDYAGAERHLLYWLEEARMGRDQRGELMIRNELAGHYRKTGEKEKALEQADAALALLDAMDYGDTVSAGTTCVNAATACSAFGENERALALFERARRIYEEAPGTDPALLGGLCNNMALTLAALGRFGEALALFDRAMEIMEKVPFGRLEQAITCLNRAEVLEKEKGPEESEKEIEALLERAYALLTEGEVPDRGYYAFVLEKCAPAFDYYGWFLAAEELRQRSRNCYGGSR